MSTRRHKRLVLAQTKKNGLEEFCIKTIHPTRQLEQELESPEFRKRLLNISTGFCRSTPDLDPDDLTQNVLVQMFKNKDHYRGEATPATWGYTIARREEQFSRTTTVVRHGDESEYGKNLPDL